MTLVKRFVHNWFLGLLFLIFLFLIFYFVSTYQYAFNYQILFNENYNLSCYCCFFLGCYSLNLVAKNKLSYYSIISLAIQVGLLLYSYLYPNREYLIVLLCSFTWFFSCQNIRLRYLRYIIFVFFLLFVYNTLICFYSILTLGVINGIMNNYGIVGIYTAINLPVIFFIIIQQIRKRNADTTYKDNIILFCLFTILMMAFTIITKSESRTAIITSFILMVMFAKKLYGNLANDKFAFISKITGIILFLILTVNFSFYISQAKERSFSGRLLMLKIAGSHSFDNFWMGTGVGRFSWFYPQWQADYFRKFASDSILPLVTNAGESYIILNEYLQLYLSIGIIGTVILVFLFVRILTAKSSKFDLLYFSIKAVVVGVLVSGVASYPLHVNIIIILFTTCLSIMVTLNNRKSNVFLELSKNTNFNMVGKAFCIIALFLCCFLGTKYWYKINAVAQWHGLKNDYSSFENDDKVYREVYPYLKHDGKFLTDYGTFIWENSLKSQPTKIQESIKILQCANRNFITRQGMESLGYAYWLKEDYKNAIYCFEWVDNFQCKPS